ncbi:MAG: hypothetical protein ACHQD8_06275 [Chitinophagales bacterium]
MIYNVVTIPPFIKRLRRLAIKYPSLKNEYLQLVALLESNPTTGISIGNHCYKIRIAIASKGKGKSGGARIFSLVKFFDNTVFLLAIFDKSEQENMT